MGGVMAADHLRKRDGHLVRLEVASVLNDTWASRDAVVFQVRAQACVIDAFAPRSEEPDDGIIPIVECAIRQEIMQISTSSRPIQKCSFFGSFAVQSERQVTAVPPSP